MNTKARHRSDGGKSHRLKLKNTGGCFFCLKAVEDFVGNGSDYSENLVSLSAIFKYVCLNAKELQSDLLQPTPVVSETATIMEGMDIAAELCMQCKRACRNVSELIGMMDELEMKVNRCLVTIQQGMNEVNVTQPEVSNSVEGLREKFLNKCSKRLSMTLSQVRTETVNPNYEMDQNVEGNLTKIENIDDPDEMEEGFVSGDPLGPDLDYSDKSYPYSNDSIKRGYSISEDDELEVPTAAISNTSVTVSTTSKISEDLGYDNFANYEKCDGQLDSGSNKYKCDYCCSTFATLRRLQTHLDGAHLGKRHNCLFPKCSKSFRWQSELCRHEKKSHPTNQERCKHCKGKHCSTPLSITCNVCHRKFCSNKSLYSHNRKGHNIVTFECGLCTKVFRTKKGLVRHIKTHASLEYLCPVSDCQTRFKYNELLTTHLELFHCNIKQENAVL